MNYERVIGFDGSGIRRVWAETLGECHIAAEEYVRRRPDTGPLSAWRFELGHIEDDCVVRAERLR
jgi:hypothetical protein